MTSRIYAMMKSPVVVIYLSLCFGVVVEAKIIPEVDASLLANKVKELTESSLKYSEMQDHLNSLRYERHILSGTTLLNEISNLLSIKFLSSERALHRLSNTVVYSYLGTSMNTTANQQCCNISFEELKNYTRFQQPVSTSKVCELVSSSAQSFAVRLQNAFRDACVDNLRSLPSLKWQYFGSEQGVTTQFPATKANSCGSYDNRFRSWYVHSKTPRRKQIVIVIDKSGSMSTYYGADSYMEMARKAAQSIINTLNYYDEFAVVLFSHDVQVYPGTNNPNGDCFRNTFSRATPQNKKQVNAFINSIAASGGTSYVPALSSAFTFFKNSSQFEDRAILFVSDGLPTEAQDSILDAVNLHSAALGNSVVILTYSLGYYADFATLRKMAISTYAEVGTSRKYGTYTAVTQPSNLRNKMASYYNFFSIGENQPNYPIWTVPHMANSELVITTSLPVYLKGKLVGVTAVDIAMEKLFADSSYFRPNEMSYSFVINDQGLIINHPNFAYAADSEPLFVEATAFERNEEFLSVFESMKRGGSGNKTFMTTRVLSGGSSQMYPMREVQVNSTYFWSQIPRTKFSLCVVLADEEVQTVLAPQESLQPGTFLYHRFDLVPPKTTCRYSGKVCVKDKSAVALATRSFRNSAHFRLKSNNASFVEALTNYMEKNNTNQTNLKHGVKDAVVATYKVNDLWEVNDNETLWRYVATKEGMFRIFPGTQMPRNFDPVTRSWYELAQANRGKWIITPPYTDVLSGLGVVTLAKTLFEGKPGGINDPAIDEPIGVMGTDIAMSHFHELVVDLYPICNQTLQYKCILVDNGGWVVSAPEWLLFPVREYSIAKWEPQIAAVLAADGVLQKRECSNIANARIQQTYEISPSQGIYAGTTGYPSCNYFELKPVNGTNAYLVIANLSYGGCSNPSPICTSCYSNPQPPCFGQAQCSCPCYSESKYYNPCTNRYILSSSSPRPCLPEVSKLKKLATPVETLNLLDQCYELGFAAKNISEEFTTEMPMETSETQTTTLASKENVGNSVSMSSTSIIFAVFFYICFSYIL